MKCWNCGTLNLNSAKICKKCGKDLAHPVENGGSVEKRTPISERKVHPLVWTILGLIGAGLLITQLFVTFFKTNTVPEVEPTEASSILIPEIVSEETKQAESEDAASSEALTTERETASRGQGEGCDWTTCAWMDVDQCSECGGAWQDYDDESYCNCSDSKWNSLELEWCKYEGGSWLQDEARCTFSTQTAKGVEVLSACSQLFYEKSSNDDEAYQTFKSDCKAAGGVDQCWDKECNLQVCLCPDENNISRSCDWVTGQDAVSSIKCYDENDTCWINIQPSSAIAGVADNEAEPEVVVTTSNGQVFSSINLDSDKSGCIYDKDQISCLFTEGSEFNAATVEDFYLCMDMCCLNLKNMEAGNVTIQSGNCPASGNLEVWDFQLLQGILTFEVRNNLGWDVNTLDVFLDDAKGGHWTTMSCQIDNKNDTIMNCEGWAVYKSGFATMNFYYGSGDNACSVDGVKFTIPWIDPCGSGQHYCSYNGGCCASGYNCCSCGCEKLGDGEVCSDVCD